MAAADRSVVGTYEAMTGRQLDRLGLDCYRLGWDLAEICGYIAVLRHPHEDTADIRASWNNLQHYPRSGGALATTGVAGAATRDAP